MDRYKIGKQIGEGSFGHVFYAIKKDTGEKRAIKRIKGAFSWDQVKVMRELQSILKLSYHRNIVRLFEVLREKDESVFFVFEYMPTGSIHDVLMNRSKNKLGPLPDTEIRSILKQVLSGLSHLHQEGFIHRDFKPENILLDGGVCKVADFSLAREVIPSNPMTSYVSTRWYRAPEILLADKRYSFPVDSFAVGCIAAELYKLRPLFPGRDECDQLKLIFAIMGTPLKAGWHDGIELMSRFNLLISDWDTSDKKSTISDSTPAAMLRQWLRRKKLPNNIADDWVLDFLLGMLALDPKKRLTARQALDHKYFDRNDEAQVNACKPQIKRDVVTVSHSEIRQRHQDEEKPRENVTGLNSFDISGPSSCTPKFQLTKYGANNDNKPKIVTVSPKISPGVRHIAPSMVLENPYYKSRKRTLDKVNRVCAEGGQSMTIQNPYLKRRE